MTDEPSMRKSPDCMQELKSKRLGEIITEISGDSRIQKFMEAGGHSMKEFKDISTADIALDMGVLTPEGKTALLVAQAAERIYLLASKAEAYARAHDYVVKAGKIISVSGDKTDYVSHDDPVFKYVGSENEPKVIQQAQGVWMAAQMLVNNEILSINEDIDNPNCAVKEISLGVESAEGFKKAAAELYATASDLLDAAGYKEAAATYGKLSKTLAARVGKSKSPMETMCHLSWQFSMGTKALILARGDEKYVPRSSVEDVFEKLIQLTAPFKKASRPEIKADSTVKNPEGPAQK